MMLHNNTKWDQTKWPVKYKTQWQEAAFALGYRWEVGGDQVTNVNNSKDYFYLSGNRITCGSTRDWFDGKGTSRFTEALWKDMFPPTCSSEEYYANKTTAPSWDSPIQHELVEPDSHLKKDEVTAELDGGELPLNWVETAAERIATYEKATKDKETIKALRYNEGKAPLSYLVSAPNAMAGLSKVFAQGAEKYARDNWKKGLDRNELVDSLLRHLFKAENGEELDPESGQHHLNHVLWNSLVLAEQFNLENQDGKSNT
jgi:hypothetical protein